MTNLKNKWFWTFIGLFWRNWMTALGATLTTISTILIAAFMILGLMGVTTPYIGIMAFLVLPGVFIIGLLLIPIGLHFDRKRWTTSSPDRAELSHESYPTFDFNQPHIRRMAGIVAVLSAANLLILSFVSYQGVVFMDSTQFCGTTCHTVMEPEYAAYLVSPHSKVRCVECHIGPGAPWFVRAKLSGVGQVLAVTLNTFKRPVPSPVENLRPSRDTCEECHWPDKFTGDRMKIIPKFSDNETNTEKKTVLLLHIGGSQAGQGGIHSWHIDPRKQTTYIATDPKRQMIPWVQVRNPDGTTTEYVSKEGGLTPEQIAKAEKRVMDCIDCHNRPTHVFKLPDQAMDEALAAGRIDRSLPYIKKIGVEALQKATGPKLAALEQMAQHVRSYYGQNYKDLAASKRETIEAAIHEIQSIYSRNVFPQMNVTWGTHPDNLGHERFTGCFRCHDDGHESQGGKTIPQDCNLCHNLLAMEEENPKVLEELQPK